MRRFRRIGLSLVLAVAMLVGLVVPVAANTSVTITMAAQIVLITNTQDAWTAGALTAGQSALTWGPSDTYSTVENTGNVAVDVAIQGTNAIDQGVPSAYNWTLATAAGNKIYSLYANSDHASTYDIEVKNAPTYSNLCTDLAAIVSDTWTWSMKLTPPTIFDAADLGNNKTATVTLVASKHV